MGDVEASLQPRSQAALDGPNRKSHRMQSCRATSKIPTPKETFRRLVPCIIRQLRYQNARRLAVGFMQSASTSGDSCK